MAFKDKLDSLLRQNKMTNADLAKRLDIGPSVLSNMKRKHVEDIPMHYLEKICAIFEIEMSDLEESSILQESGATYGAASVTETLSATLLEQHKMIRDQYDRIKELTDLLLKVK